MILSSWKWMKNKNFRNWPIPTYFNLEDRMRKKRCFYIILTLPSFKHDSIRPMSCSYWSWRFFGPFSIPMGNIRIPRWSGNSFNMYYIEGKKKKKNQRTKRSKIISTIDKCHRQLIIFFHLDMETPARNTFLPWY